MRVDECNGTIERSIIIACISRTDFLSRLVTKLEKNPFRAKPSNLIYSWCRNHFLEYNSAPGKLIETLFANWASSNQDKEAHATIDRLLTSLSGEYERLGDEIHLEFLTDQASAFFNMVMLERLREDLDKELRLGGTEAALAAHQKFKKLDLRVSSGVDILRDKQLQKESLETAQKALIRYPGAAGEFFGDEFCEDGFVGLIAQSKGRKSWTLLDLAWRAFRQGRKVAYYQVGDLSKHQIMRRFLKRAVYRSLQPKTVRLPIGIMLPAGERQLAMVDYEDRVFENAITWQTAEKAFEKAAKQSSGCLQLFYHPTHSISILDIRNNLEFLAREGWKPDVVTIDYAGNLANMDSKGNMVDQVGLTWAYMRQISEEGKRLVLTASQSNKEGFSSWVLTRKNFSGSKMIFAHVTAMLGINVTDEESTHGIIRYNWAARRDADFSESHCLYCASCLDVGNPIVCSFEPERRM